MSRDQEPQVGPHKYIQEMWEKYARDNYPDVSKDILELVFRPLFYGGAANLLKCLLECKTIREYAGVVSDVDKEFLWYMGYMMDLLCGVKDDGSGTGKPN